MKNIQPIIMIVLLAGFAQGQRVVPTKAVFAVKNDAGSPVAGARIEGGFRDISDKGSRDRFIGVTNTNGEYVAYGNTMVDVGAMVTAEGYYRTITSVPISERQKAGMKRWDVTVPVLLKPVRNPIPMCVREVRNPYVSPRGAKGKYCLYRTSGYDIVKGEFLPPYGGGVVPDMVFEWEMSIFATNKVGRALDYDTCCTVSVTNVVDGLCKGNPDGDMTAQEGSYFLSAYIAPISTYHPVWSFSEKARGQHAEMTDDQHYLYYFRIRTQTNNLGQVTNALYGKIYGHLNGTFTYYLNPTPKERNVEFDPKRNILGAPDGIRSFMP